MPEGNGRDFSWSSCHLNPFSKVRVEQKERWSWEMCSRFRGMVDRPYTQVVVEERVCLHVYKGTDSNKTLLKGILSLIAMIGFGSK